MLFVTLAITVLALLALVVSLMVALLRQQSQHIHGETSKLREMICDLLNEQDIVTERQNQLGAALLHLQDQVADIAEIGLGQAKCQAQQTAIRSIQDNESWAYLISLLATIQDRFGALSRERTRLQAGLHDRELFDELEQEMRDLPGISEEMAISQSRQAKLA